MSQPTSAATAERTFSGLRRLKTWVRNTMTQKRLTQLAVMHVNDDILDDNQEMLHEVLREFISRTPKIRSIFGGGF